LTDLRGDPAMSDAVLSATSEQLQASRTWQVWAVAKQEILYLCWALMEIALLTPIALTFMGWARFWSPGQVTLWLLLLMLLPFNLVRFLSALQMDRKYQWRVILVVLLFTLLATWRILLFNPLPLFDFSWLAELFGNIGESNSLWARTLILFLLLLFVWWRGLRLVQLHPDIYSVGLRLRAGILIFVPIALLPRSGGSVWGFMPFVLLYFLSGLMVVSLIRAEQVERERSGFAASLSPRWVGTIFATSLLVVLAAALFATLISGDTLSLVLQWLSPVRMAILAGTVVAFATAFYLASPLFALLELFLTWLTDLLSTIFLGFSDNLGLDIPVTLDAFDNILPAEEEAAEVIGFTIPAEVTRTVTVLLMLAVVLLLSYALTRRFRQPSNAPHAGGPVRAAGGSTLPGEGIGQRLLQRLGILRRWRTAASIRQLYQAMCDASTAAGHTRSPSETPYEYLATLGEVWPGNQPDTQLITEAYVRVRYGEVPETEEELQAIKQAWRRLEESSSAELAARN
jgi:hypothetical protein